GGDGVARQLQARRRHRVLADVLHAGARQTIPAARTGEAVVAAGRHVGVRDVVHGRVVLDAGARHRILVARIDVAGVQRGREAARDGIGEGRVDAVGAGAAG
nr:hypothetical protein [Tanacetum cinerariifolium]